MQEQKIQSDSLVPFAMGVGVGVIAIWALVELFPLLVVGGLGYMVLKGLHGYGTIWEKETCQENGQNKNFNSSNLN